MRKYRFYKNELGWFIDLKFFPFNKAWLSMVAGADTLLDRISMGRDNINLQISTSPIPYSDGVLELTQKLGTWKGAMYEGKKGFTNDERVEIDSIWLCPATLWVFWKYPKKIYFKIVN